MPAFNCEKFIDQAITSILNQTYHHWELLISDDSSRDSTRSIIDGYAAKNDRIITSHNQVNQKLLKTRNRLLKFAKGDLITFQDADDFSHPDRLTLMVAEFNRNNKLGLLASQVAYINEKGDVIRTSNKPTIYADTIGRMYVQNVVGGSIMMIKRSALENVGGNFRKYFDGLSNQDYDLALLIAQQYEAYCLPEVLYYYRQHDNSASKIISIERLLAREVVIHLAKQRRDRGYDDLMIGCEDLVDSYFSDLKKPYVLEPSKIFREYAGNLMYNGLNYKAIIASWQAVKNQPKMLINWRTFFYCLRRTLIKI